MLSQRIPLLVLPLALLAAPAAAQIGPPPLVNYIFDQGGTPPTVTNWGSLGGNDPLVGHSLTGTAPDTSPCLLGAGTGQVTTSGSGFTVNFGNGDWTLGFCLDTSANNGLFQYTSGEGAGGSWRTFVNGAAGAGNIVMRGGIPDVVITGGAGDTGWVHVAWVYDSAAGQIRGYRNGQLDNTVSAGPLNLSSGSNLLIGNHITPIQTGTQMEDFRLYDRALSGPDVQLWACSCLAGLLGFEYQPNQPTAHLDIDGQTHDPQVGPIQVTKGLGATATINFNSTLTSAWELVLTSGAPAVPASGGGLVLAGCPAQVFNIDLAAPSLFVANALQFNNTFAPFSIPVTIGFSFQAEAQFAILDPGQASGLSLSAPNELRFAPVPCITVEAVGSNSFNSTTASGFWRVVHRGSCLDWIESLTIDFAAAAAGTPAAQQRFDTNQSGMSDRFDGGNSVVANCTGTYRNGSDAATGLVYDALNTPPATCDPGANTGWIGSNPGTSAGDFRTLQLRFSPVTFNGQTFEFDADTDGNTANGGGMAGTVVTVVVANVGGPTTLTGTLQADPNDPNRSFVDFL